MQTEVKVDINLGRVLSDPSAITRIADFAMEAGLFIVENEYVDQSPGMDGDFKQGIEPHRNAALDYIVRSTAEDNGENYPLNLYQGTGKLKGQPDYGFTTGHVRAGTVAYGVGGIRPNKAADRTRENSEGKFIDFVRSRVGRDILK